MKLTITWNCIGLNVVGVREYLIIGHLQNRWLRRSSRTGSPRWLNRMDCSLTDPRANHKQLASPGGTRTAPGRSTSPSSVHSHATARIAASALVAGAGAGGWLIDGRTCPGPGGCAGAACPVTLAGSNTHVRRGGCGLPGLAGGRRVVAASGHDCLSAVVRQAGAVLARRGGGLVT